MFRMERAKQAVHLVLLGIKDCLYGILSLIHFLFSKDTDSSRQNLQCIPGNRDNPQKPVSDILSQCFVFGFLFWVFNYVFNHVLLDNVFIQFVIFVGNDLKSVIWLKKFLYGVFLVTFISPMLFLNKFLNMFWYQDIANLIFKKTGIKKVSSSSLSDDVANLSFSFILQTLYYFQAYAVYLLPLPAVIQSLWYLIHLSLLFSLYAFEYKWIHMGWTLQRRLLTIDRKWPYFLGFGLPLAAASTFDSSFIDSMIIFSSLFSVYVLSSTFTNESQSPAFIHPLHTFKIVDSVTDQICSFFLKMICGVKNVRR